MSSLAEATEGFDCQFGLLDGYGDDLGFYHLHEPVEKFAAGFELAAFDDQTDLDTRDGGQDACGCGLDRLGKTSLIGFIEKDRDNSRGVDHHMPVSS